MLNNAHDIVRENEQLKIELAFVKANYKKLQDQVAVTLKAQDDCRKSGNRGDLTAAKWKAEADLKKMINPEKVKQSVIDWLAV